MSITQQAKPVVNCDHDDVILCDNMADVDVSASGAVRTAVDVEHNSAQRARFLHDSACVKLTSRLTT